MADTIKPEIKLDPGATAVGGSPMNNLEEFEDDTDLHIPPPPPPAGEGPQAWLVKVPSHLWQAWNDIYRNTADETPIEIGKMRVYHQKPGEAESERRIQIRLTHGVPQHRELPKNYDLNLQTTGYSNTVVFSEKDLPGHTSGRAGISRSRSPNYLAANKPTGIPAKTDRYGTKPGTYRSAIPKQTALAPLIHHVADATPVQDQSYYDHFKKTYKSSLLPKKQTTFQTGIDRTLHPGAASNLANFSSFGLTSRPSGRKAPPKEKAVRMGETELIDRLYQCFRRYRYWSLKALKNELRQPETFIKQMLESIAVLVRSGDFAMNYKLKDEYVGMANVKPEEIKEDTAAPIKSEDEGSVAEDGDMDEDDDFEDVEMDG